MAGKTTDNSNQANLAGQRIGAIQDFLLNRVLILGLVLSSLGAALSVARIPDTGFQIAHVAHIIVCAILTLAVVFKNKTPYVVRLWIPIGISVVSGGIGLLSYSFVGQGSIILLFAVLIATVFGDPRTSYAVLTMCTLVIILFMLLTTSQAISFSFDANEYILAYSSWNSFLIVFFMLAFILSIVTNGLVGNLKSLAKESIAQGERIRTLNETLEEKVQLRTAELAKSNNDKDRILGVVAHDINNKLNTISGYAELLARKKPTLDDAKQKKFVEMIDNAATYAEDIVQELMEHARNSDADIPINLETTDISSFVWSSVESHLPRAMDKRIDLKMKATHELSLCDINKTKLSRVIDNLVTNAIKFTPRGGSITVSIQNHIEGALLKVSDTGIGVPADMQEDLFRPFSTSRRAGTEREKSIGLGLSISKTIMKQHFGKIWLESREGQGSTFFLLFPFSASKESETDSRQVKKPIDPIIT